MILGMTTATFTLRHVILRLVAVAAGIVVLFGMLASERLEALEDLVLLLFNALGVLAVRRFHRPIKPSALGMA